MVKTGGGEESVFYGIVQAREGRYKFPVDYNARLGSWLMTFQASECDLRMMN